MRRGGFQLDMKRLLTILPWAALMTIGVISVPKLAQTTPPEGRHIREAIRELRETRRELEGAAHDYCGHKADAIRQVDEAIKQLQFAADCRR
jgi:hypothetical protein